MAQALTRQAVAQVGAWSRGMVHAQRQAQDERSPFSLLSLIRRRLYQRHSLVPGA